MEGTNAAGIAASFKHRSTPIGRDEWMSLMSAIRAIVGPRLFRSSVRAAMEHLEHQPRSPSPKGPKKAVVTEEFQLPGAVQPSQQTTAPKPGGVHWQTATPK